MASPIEKFSATLAGITTELTQAASTRVNEETVMNAAANGDEQAVLEAARQMSTADLLALQRRLGS